MLAPGNETQPANSIMKTLCSFLLLALSLVVTLAAEPSVQPTKGLSALKLARDEAEKTYEKGVESLPDTPEGEKASQKFWQTFDQKQSDLFMSAVDLARRDPKSQEALEALEWVLTLPRSYFLTSGIPALELVTRHHAANPKVGKIVAWVGYYLPHERAEARPAALALIEAVAETNPDRTARGQAIIARAWEARKRHDQTAGAAEASAAEKAFELVLKEYADCPRLMRPKQRTLGEEAQQELFALRNLLVGKTAPEITGDDLEGVKFKLSDYRGKVVALVFWASWCGPCMQMVPQERELVEHMKGKPFVLIGVNGDSDRKDAQKAVKKEGIRWRSFWNGSDARSVAAGTCADGRRFM